MKKFRYKKGEFNLDGKAHVMGIVNVTPDSFSDGGEYFNPQKAIEHCLEIEKSGASIIDLGAMSTRPGSEPVSADTEIERLAPVLEVIKKKCSAVISVDTVNPETMEYVLNHGAHIINDVSGFFNSESAKIIKKYSAGWIVTHTGNVPAGVVLDYPDGVVNSVNEFFDCMLEKCSEYGIEKDFICLDPGFGFAKTTEDNVILLKNLEKVIRNDVAFLTGLSRKRFIGALTNVETASQRLIGTVTADVVAVLKGSDFIRVHDVKEAYQSLKIINNII